MSSAEVYRDVAESAWSWVLRQLGDEDGPWLPEVVSDDDPATGPGEDRDSLYAGIAGLAPVFAEISASRALSEAEQSLAAGIVARLTAEAPSRVEPSLYIGLGGDVTALRLLAPGSERIALQRLGDLMTPAGWNTTLKVGPTSGAPVTDLVLGTAGVVLAALWADGERAHELAATGRPAGLVDALGSEAASERARELAATGGEALLRVAEPTEAGLDWRLVPGWPSSSPNYSHGTAGVATALAIAGRALDRDDFIAAARKGAEHLLSVASLDDDGFIVPHTLPYSTRDVEPVTYSWCHGPTGTSHLFAALAYAGVEEISGLGVGELRQRCLNSILTSGIPQRIRPGFWDNDGRCCGTAGVGDVLLDAAQDGTDPVRVDALLVAARRMGDAVVERAIRDDAGTRWRFLEHRQNPPLLPPNTSWMQGAAGIAAFLFRLARVTDDGLQALVVDRPDQWWAVPAALRTVHV